MTIKNRALIACHECDLLQREAEAPSGGEADCVRCGAGLYRNKPHGQDRALAFLLAACILFVFANAFPLMELDANGIASSATLFDTVREMHQTGMTSIALLVFFTTILFPALELAAMVYILVPLKLGVVPRSIAPVYRVLIAIRPWGMIEVFMLGVLIAHVKLAQIATVYTGVALYALGGFMMLFAAAEASFEPRTMWQRVEELQGREGVPQT